MSLSDQSSVFTRNNKAGLPSDPQLKLALPSLIAGSFGSGQHQGWMRWSVCAGGLVQSCGLHPGRIKTAMCVPCMRAAMGKTLLVSSPSFVVWLCWGYPRRIWGCRYICPSLGTLGCQDEYGEATCLPAPWGATRVTCPRAGGLWGDPRGERSGLGGKNTAGAST